jgi:hypothetical protein
MLLSTCVPHNVLVNLQLVPQAGGLASCSPIHVTMNWFVLSSLMLTAAEIARDDSSVAQERLQQSKNRS